MPGSGCGTPEAALAFVRTHGIVLVCRLVDGKLTLVHRRLWPLLASLAGRFAPERIARVKQEHTASGRHVNTDIAFPDWVPAEVLRAARTADAAEALKLFGSWLA